MTGNDKVIRFCFGNTRCDGPDTNLSAQFYTDSRIAIGIFKIVNQLCDIFNGINIVVWWWADQTNAWCRMANLGNITVDLAAR